MSIPKSGQTVHLINWLDVVRTRRKIEGRNKAELQLYTTDDLRRLYQDSGDDPIRLRDGIVTRTEMVAEIRWRVMCDSFGYDLVLVVSTVGAVAAVVAAVEGWK